MVFGGQGHKGELLGDLWVYIMDLETWEIGKPTVGRSHHAACVHGDSMYVFGGFTQKDKDIEMCILDLNELSWSFAAPRLQDGTSRMPRRVGMAAATLENEIYIFGGSDAGETSADLYCFQIRDMQKIKKVQTNNGPAARSGCTLVTVNRVVFLFGGVDNNNMQLNDLWKFDPANRSQERWEEVAVLNPEMGPRPRSYHSAVVHGHVVIVFGGHGNDTCDSNEVFHLNVKTLEWHLKSAGSDHASIFRAPQ